MQDYAEEFNGSLQTGNYRKAKFVYRGSAGDTVIEDVGFRTKGRFTRIIPQDDEGEFHRAHFKVKFDKPFDLEEGSDEFDGDPGQTPVLFVKQARHHPGWGF